MRTGKGADEDFAEERNRGEQNGGLPSLVTLRTLSVCNRRLIATHLPSGCSLILMKGLANGWFMLCKGLYTTCSIKELEGCLDF